MSDSIVDASHGGFVFSLSERQRLLLGLCVKPESSDTVAKLRELIRSQNTWDASFVLCVDESGGTPLHLACKANNFLVSEVLVNETNVRLTCRDAHDWLAIHYAIQNYNVPLVDLLLKRSPQRLLTHQQFGEAKDTLLHFVSRIDGTSQATLVERLVLLGADPCQENARGETAYSIAKERGSCAAFYFNNYVLNRTIYYDRAVILPDDIDDDEVQVRRREGLPETSDGYSGHERKCVKYNTSWWTEGLDGVRHLSTFVMQGL